MSEILGCWGIHGVFRVCAPSLQEQHQRDEDDHEQDDDDIADDGHVVSCKVEADGAINEADGDNGGADKAVDFDENSGLLLAFPDAVVHHAKGPLR